MGGGGRRRLCELASLGVACFWLDTNTGFSLSLTHYYYCHSCYICLYFTAIEHVTWPILIGIIS